MMGSMPGLSGVAGSCGFVCLPCGAEMVGSGPTMTVANISALKD